MSCAIATRRKERGVRSEQKVVASSLTTKAMGAITPVTPDTLKAIANRLLSIPLVGALCASPQYDHRDAQEVHLGVRRLFREWSAGKGGGYPRFGVVSVS